MTINSGVASLCRSATMDTTIISEALRYKDLMKDNAFLFD